MVRPARVLCWLALVLVTALLLPAGARADGDPGSDVLLNNSFFAAADAGLSVGQQLSLGRLLAATKVAGAQVRVAIISHEEDLGAVTWFWGESPQAYAVFLGTELKYQYPGRLLIVTPGGYGVYWQGHSVSSAAGALSRLPVPRSSTAVALVAAAERGTRTLDAATGVSAAKLQKEMATVSRGSGVGIAPASSPSGSGVAFSNAAVPRIAGRGGSSGGLSTSVIAVILVAAALGIFCLWRWRQALVTALARFVPQSQAGAVRRGLAFAIIAVGGLVVVAVVVHGSGNPAQLVSSAQSNPNLDAGTTLAPLREAPNFRLADEDGRNISLSQYRGKVVILSFIDDECQTICPLTTQAMLDAMRSLGAAGKDVVLLGVDANWKSTQIQDVLDYTDFHGMSGQWHFLTGSLPQLNRVWTAYHLNELKLIEKAHGNANVIDHVIQTYVIDPRGRLRTSYLTDSSYSAIPQLGQLFAQEAARLLPSHPKVSTNYSYADVRGTSPTTTAQLQRVGGGNLTVGPGHPHVYVFFDTWNRQTTAIRAQLDQLNAYAADARREGLPTPVAVDEASVEPSARALPTFLNGLKLPLTYPVVLDRTGQLADGYDVAGEPWFVITGQSGQIAWYREVYTSTWPTNATLQHEARDALKSANSPALGLRATQRALTGSPAPLAKLHFEAAAALNGGTPSLRARIRALRGYPIVVNVWYSTCPPCQAEAHLFATAASTYGRAVAFIGADTEDSSSSASLFMRQHNQAYPTYLTPTSSLNSLLVGGLGGTPTTIFINRAGKIAQSFTGPYGQQSVLDGDIQTYALGG